MVGTHLHVLKEIQYMDLYFITQCTIVVKVGIIYNSLKRVKRLRNKSLKHKYRSFLWMILKENNTKETDKKSLISNYQSISFDPRMGIKDLTFSKYIISNKEFSHYF